MKKIVAVIVIVVIAVVAWLAFSGSNGKNNSTRPPSGQSTLPQATNSVMIQNFAFNPSSITVKKGTAVTWTNKDSTGHTVTESDGQTGPASQILGSGQSYTFTYSQPGTYRYHCTIHTEMTGTVTVTD